MTNQEATAIVSQYNLAEAMRAKMDRTRDRLESNYGEREKRKDHDQQSLIFARALMSAGGTFEFTEDHEKIGYSTIFEAMAADWHERGANLKTQINNGAEFEHIYRQGCAHLNQKLMDEWNDVVVYTVPRRVDDKAIKVITLNPDHVVNNLGQTAAQVNALREEKRANGQMTASAKKLARSVGEQKALDTLSSIVTKISSMVALPRGAREVELLDNRGDTVLVEEMPNFLKSS